MTYRAWRGPESALVPLEGLLGGAVPVTVSHGAAPVQDSIDVRTAADADTNHWVQGSGGFIGADLSFLPRSGASDARATFMRFQVAIPQGATILAATLTVYQNQNAAWTGADDRTLGIHQVDDGAAPGSRAAADTALGQLGTTHVWANSGTINNSQPVPTGDIAALVQQIVNRGGWVSGNHMLFLYSHPGGGSTNHQTRLHQGQAEGVRPRLQVDFEYTP